MIKNDFWYLASYPKSGNTWIRVFIIQLLREKEKLFNSFSKNEKGIERQEFRLNSDLNTGTIISSRDWIDDQLGLNSSYLRNDELDKLRDKLGFSLHPFDNSLRYHKVHDNFNSSYSKNRSVIRDKGCMGVIYIIRNPSDLVVSMKNFFSWSIKDTLEFITNKNAVLKSYSQANQFLGSWSDHVNSWTNQKKIPILVVRYEDLILNPEKFFQKISRFLKIKSSEESIKKAIRNSSFEKLKKLEKNEGGFLEKPLKCKTFFRSGLIGEGSKILDENQKAMLNDKFEKELKKFNYNV